MIEKFIDLFAPTRCISCLKTGSVLCESCAESVYSPISRCYRCHKATTQFQVCATCRKKIKLKHVWVVADFSGIPKELIHLFKFERLSSASKILADEMTKVLPLLPEGTVICRVPTAPTRIRIRGYDQADLLARHISKSTGLSKMDLINRTSNSRQLGSSRRGRFINAKKSYEVINPSKVSGKNILLVDDVTTSGATLETIAELLKQAGAKNIDAVVYSQAID